MKKLEINGVQFEDEELIHVRINSSQTELKVLAKFTEEKKLINAIEGVIFEEASIKLFNDKGEVICHHVGFADVVTNITLANSLIEQATFTSIHPIV